MGDVERADHKPQTLIKVAGSGWLRAESEQEIVEMRNESSLLVAVLGGFGGDPGRQFGASHD